MNKIDAQYQALLQDILDNGVKKETRNGGTISVFGRQIRHRMSEGFPLLTTKKMAFKTMVTELLWFLRGDTNIKYLVENGCHIWDGDAYKRYLIEDAKYMTRGSMESWKERGFHLSKEEFIERIKTDDGFAKKWGDLGPIYGKQWRNWEYLEDYDYHEGDSYPGTKSVDQIANLINDLKTNPDSRRLMVSAWNVGEIDSAVLPPCHYGFQVYTRELSARERTALGSNGSTRLYDMIKERDYKTIDADTEMHKVCDEAGVPTRAISLMFNMRSNDVPLGLPFNIASYALLLEIICKMVNMVPDELIANMGDCHIYKNQIDGINEQLTREPYELPKLVHMKTDDFYKTLSEDLSLLTHLDVSDFVIENYKSHPAIKIPLSN